MTNIQIFGIAVAVVILVVLVIVLIVTRGKSTVADQPSRPPVIGEQAASTTGGSFLDEAPRDEFAKLGKPTVAPSEPAANQVAEQAIATEVAATAETAPESEPPKSEPLSSEAAQTEAAQTEAAQTQAAATVEVTPKVAHDEATSASLAEPSTTAPALAEPSTTGPALAEPSTTAPAADQALAAEQQPVASVETEEPNSRETTSDSKGVPLSDVIVTTNQQKVDLEDPEVRRLLKDLVEYEIQLAQQYKGQGQTLDAILQLTEAEKACNALGLTSKARLIRAMIKELNG